MATEHNRDACPDCEVALVFDPTVVGFTCGGLKLRGWDRCPNCGSCWVSKQAEVDSTDERGRWRIARGGRSLDVGGMRFRPEKTDDPGGPLPIIRRLARTPALEMALQAIVAGGVTIEQAQALAAAALSTEPEVA